MTKLFESEVDIPDQEYLYIKNNPKLEEARRFLEQLWPKFEPYADTNYKVELARQFHRRFWEMYLACVLLDHGHRLAMSRKKGPDICIETIDHRTWIEATAPGSGVGTDAIPQPQTSLSSIPEMYMVPEKQIILRYRSAIEEKYRRYIQYLNDKVIDPHEPYVIAVNGRRVPFSFPDDDEIPYIVKAALPFGDYSAIIDWDANKVVSGSYEYRPEISKQSGASVSTRIFLDNQYASISGVLFSNADLLNRPQESGTEFIFLHNPKASNSLSLGWLKTGIEFWIEGTTLKKQLQSAA